MIRISLNKLKERLELEVNMSIQQIQLFELYITQLVSKLKVKMKEINTEIWIQL